MTIDEPSSMTELMSDTKAGVSDVVGRARHGLAEEASAKVNEGLHGLRSVADKVAALAEGRTEEAGAIGTVVSDVGRRFKRIATSLDERGASGVVDDVRGYARRRPAVFLMAALGAGFAVGRLVRMGMSGSMEVDEAASMDPTTEAATSTPYINSAVAT